ncbi:hypothetical protein RHMOL_Rhmol02G0030800 [Rhododendron molle]|uniref:Uncharacterized protein n=1 Tax=Rhododendron molle TaxID=49168 RepID=A0ACC0PMC9_RHOML|nr:hypothetical protein RHMOL_Rhmol02G0030800 [Rhododendron molle]
MTAATTTTTMMLTMTITTTKRTAMKKENESYGDEVPDEEAEVQEWCIGEMEESRSDFDLKSTKTLVLLLGHGYCLSWIKESDDCYSPVRDYLVLLLG